MMKDRVKPAERFSDLTVGDQGFFLSAAEHAFRREIDYRFPRLRVSSDGKVSEVDESSG